MHQITASRRARSVAPPLFALVAVLVFGLVVIASTGCSVSPDTIETVGGLVDATQGIATGAAVTATGGPATPWAAVIAGIIALGYSEVRVRVLAWSRDRRKRQGADPLQLAGVATPPPVSIESQS